MQGGRQRPGDELRIAVRHERDHPVAVRAERGARGVRPEHQDRADPCR